MASSELSHLANDPGKAERLFRAAIAAFCSIPRPSRREVAQLDDLALPLFSSVSVESRRYVAAALSECVYAPHGLVLRLAGEPVDISAPLLIRSPLLTDVDLIALIGRHGLAHARAIARRPDLNPTIAGLVRALDSSLTPEKKSPETSRDERPAFRSPSIASAIESPLLASVEGARRRLRAMMRPAQDEVAVNPCVGPDAWPKLCETALMENPAFFRTALADAVGIDFVTASFVAGSASYPPLVSALRICELSVEQAFFIASALFPAEFGSVATISLFFDRYRNLSREAATERVRSWKAADITSADDGPHPVGFDDRIVRLKAS